MPVKPGAPAGRLIWMATSPFSGWSSWLKVTRCPSLDRNAPGVAAISFSFFGSYFNRIGAWNRSTASPTWSVTTTGDPARVTTPSGWKVSFTGAAGGSVTVFPPETGRSAQPFNGKFTRLDG